MLLALLLACPAPPSPTPPEDTATPSGPYTAVAAGEFHNCAIAEGVIRCWGAADEGQLDAPDGDDWVALGAGRLHTCALAADGRVVCWGDDGLDQVSDAPTGSFAELAVGGTHACARDASGRTTCWGFAQASDGFASGYTAISAGNTSTCGVTEDGFECVGTDGAWEVAGEFAALSAGWDHVCALSETGGATCHVVVEGFEDPDDPSGGTSEVLALETPAGAFAAISAGYDETCALSPEGALVCWGTDEDGVVSDAPEGEFSAISVAWHHGCAVAVDGSVTCWGANGDGQGGGP